VISATVSPLASARAAAVIGIEVIVRLTRSSAVSKLVTRRALMSWWRYWAAMAASKT
jgi:hypothetical protein